MGFRYVQLVEIFVFFGVLGPVRSPNSAKLLLASPITAPQGKKKSANNFFSTANGSKPPSNHVLSKSKKKTPIFDQKKFDPTLPRNLLCRARAPCSAGQRRCALMPLPMTDSFETRYLSGCEIGGTLVALVHHRRARVTSHCAPFSPMCASTHELHMPQCPPMGHPKAPKWLYIGSKWDQSGV